MTVVFRAGVDSNDRPSRFSMLLNLFNFSFTMGLLLIFLSENDLEDEHEGIVTLIVYHNTVSSTNAHYSTNKFDIG